MPTHAPRRVAGLALFALALPALSAAQTIGTFHWRMEPYCNTLTLTVVQDAAGIRLQGYEDLCDPIYAPQPVEGSAVLDNNGVARVGLSTGVPSGFTFEGNRVILSIDTTTLNGSWLDDAGGNGTLLRVSTPTSSGMQRGERPNSFLHVVSAENRPAGAADNVSCFSHPLADGRPSALIVFSPNRGGQSALRPFVGSTVSLYYDDDGTGLEAPLDNNVWCLSRDDSQAMPIGAGFTVRITPH
ncbi:MAG: hypothetical protein IT177_11510 [Acidobacteria bacterium]|nr:hypothetical protein [Acidobacteriota bacterium]